MEASNGNVLVELRSVRKEYGTVRAIDGLSFFVKRGEVYGLLGPNGAGKTSTMKILSGIERATSGSVSVAGYDPASDPLEVKKRVGYVPESSALYESLSPREFLEFVGSTRAVSPAQVARAKVIAEALELGAYFDLPIGSLSMGTKQKVAVVAALIHEPPVLLLDEPLNGLDAKSGRIFKELVSIHAEKGGAVVFSTHVMQVAESVCTRIGIMDHGKVVAEGSMSELRALGGGRVRPLEELFLQLTNADSSVQEVIDQLRRNPSLETS